MINDEDRLDSLLKFYFNGYGINSCIKIASERAYRDLCRTLRLKEQKISDDDNKKLRSKIDELLENKILKYLVKKNIDQEDFDKWHEEVSEEIINIYEKGGYEKFHYGQSQKWINMTLKYLFIIDYKEEIKGLKNIYKFCHLPFDNIIIKILENKGYIKEFKADTWSGMNKEEYGIYLREIRTNIKNNGEIKYLLDIDFQLWKN